MELSGQAFLRDETEIMDMISLFVVPYLCTSELLLKDSDICSFRMCSYRKFTNERESNDDLVSKLGKRTLFSSQPEIPDAL
jgi:hypothetical protein